MVIDLTKPYVKRWLYRVISMLLCAFLCLSVLNVQSVLAASENTPILCPSSETGEPDQYIYTEGTYALCDRHVCVPDPSNPTELTLCYCDVFVASPDVPALGFGPSSSEYTFSIFSYALNDQIGVRGDNQFDGAKGGCYGAPCTIDVNDPKHAFCHCPLDATQPPQPSSTECLGPFYCENELSIPPNKRCTLCNSTDAACTPCPEPTPAFSCSTTT